MALKLLDIQYLRAQNTIEGQVFITTSNLGVQTTSNLVVKNQFVGIGTTDPQSNLQVVGNIMISNAIGSIGSLIFPDLSIQTTRATKLYMNADFENGLDPTTLIPGDFYYDDINASIYIVVASGPELQDLTVRSPT